MAKIKQSKLNEIKGYNEYKKRKEEKEQKAQKEESAAQAASPSTSNTKTTSSTTSNKTNTTSNKTSTTSNTTISSTTKGAKIKQSKLDSIKGYNAYKARREARERNVQVPPNSTPVADKTKLNDGYTIESIRENLGYSQTALEDSIKRLEESKNVLTSSENEVTNFLKKYGATAEDIHSKMATKYGAKLDTSGKYIFEDEQSYNDYQKEIAALGALYDQYNANMNQYNALYTQYQDSAVNYEDWYGRLEGYQPRDATLKDLLWNSLKQGYYNSVYGQESYKQMLGDENQAAAYKELLSGEDYQFETDNWLEKAVSGAANQMGQQYRQWTDPRSLASGTAFAGGAFALGQAGPQALVPEEVITVPGAFIAGMQAGSAASNFEIEGGLAYQEMLEQGISPEVARIIGLSVGGGNAALEALQADELIKGLKVFNNKQGYESVAELLYAELKRRFPNLANQVIQEVAQEGVTIGGTQLASYIDKGELAYTMPETLQRLGETALSSTLTFGLMDVPGATMNVAANKANVNRLGKIGSEYNVDAEAVIAEGLEMPKNTEAYQTAVELKAKVDAGQTVSDAELGRAVVANEMAIQQNQVTDEAAQPAEKAQKALENLARDAVAHRENFQQAEPTQSETVSEQATVPYNVMADTNPVRQKKVAETRSLEKKLGYGEEGLKLFKEIAAETNVDTDELMVRFDTPYQAGLTGLPMAKANLVDNFQTEAYNAGRMDNIARMAKDKESKPATIYSEAESGFDFTNAPSDLTQEQKDFAVFFNKAMGVKGEFNGYEGVNYNAKYSKSTGVVAFAQDFGIDSKLMKKLGSMEYQQKVEKLVETRGKSFIFYFAHEVADHVASNRAPAAMRAFNNAMYNYQQSSAGNENLARSKQAFYGDNKVDLSTEGAIEEVGADSILMLYDGDEQKFMDAMKRVLNGNDKQAKEGAKLYKNKLDEIIQKLKAWFRKLTGKENAEARANLKQGISELEQLRDMFEKAIGESAAVVKKARADRDVATVKEELGAGATIQRNKNGELLLAKSKDNSTIIYSLKTYQDGGKDKLREALLRNGHTRTEIDSVLELIDDAADYLTILAAGYAKSHNYTALHDHLIADITTNVKTGKQVMSALVNNGDYPVNFDMALICKKRIAYMTLMTRLIEDGIFDLVNFKGEAIADVNDILRANNFETACLGCFVESRRLQFQAWAETIVSEWNAEVDKRKKNAKEFGFSKGRVKLTDTEMDFLQNELKNAGKKNKQGNLNLGKGSAQVRIGRLLDMVPSLQQRLTVADLLTPNGLAALREYDANLFSIVKSRYGAASPKIVQDFNPYASEIAMMTFKSVSEITSNAVKGAQEYIKQAKKDLGGIKKMAGETDAEFRKRRAAHNAKAETEAMRRYLYDIGGARIQSFSDFMIENVFDYLQIMADLSANRFPLHGYTKENICLRLFGMTGAKWNGSLIAHVERSMGKEYAGLLPASAAKDGSAILVHTEDGDYAIGFDDYQRNKATGGKSFIQSIGMKDIIAVQLDPRYSKNVGSITIGVSDKQILAMLDSPLFSMVIPYHASGMLPGFARRVGVDMYNDYTDYQNTSVRQMYDANGNIVESLVNAKGDTIKIDTSYAFNAEVQKTGDARTAANNYIKWCAERHPVYDGKTLVGYATFSPKFSNSPYGTDFSRHPNYYKLLADFNTYDCITGESAVQGAVTMTFPSENNRLTASQMEAYKQRLRDTGVFSEKEIAKYEAQANKTFKDLVNDELKGRADYKVTQDAKWEKTVKEIKDKLMSDHARTADEQFSLKDSQGNELTQEQAEYFKDSKVRDKDGNLLRLYHGTQAFGFTKVVFDKSDDGISFFMTDSPSVAASYSGTSRMRSVVKVDGKPVGRIDPYTASIEELVEEYNSVSLSDNVQLLSTKEDLQKWADRHMEWARREIKHTSKMLRDLYDNVFTQKFDDEKTNAYIEEAKEAFRLYYEAYQLAESAKTSSELYAARGAMLEAQEDEHSRKVDKGNIFYSMFRPGIQAHGVIQDLYGAAKAVLAAERGEAMIARGNEEIFDDETLREDLEYEYQTADGSEYGNYELYANLTEPLIIEAFHATWNNITIPGNMDRDEFQKIAGNKRFNEAKTRDFAKYAKAKGYDGVIFKNLVDTGSEGIGHEGASTVVIAFDSNKVKDAYNKTPTSDPDIRYSLKVTDEKTLDFLNEQIERGEYDPVKNPNGGYIKVYRSFQVINGKLYAPMNAVDRDADGKNHRLGYNSQYGVWEMSTESPEIAQRYMDAHPDAPYAMFDLDGVDNKTGGVAYNPYLHASNLVLNDQFSAAYRRNLITVECYVPISEANGAYRAQYAKDATGWVEWKPGGVAGKLMKKKPEYTRKLFVSRYMLPVREVPSSEVASMYKEYLDGTGIKVPWNVVTPDLRRELVKAGVPIDYDKDVYQSKDKETGEKKYARFDEVFPGERQAQFSLKDQDYMKAVNAGDMETAQRMVDEAAEAAGYDIEGYHGTEYAGFTSIKGALWLARDRNVAATYGTYRNDYRPEEEVAKELATKPYDKNGVYYMRYRLGKNLHIDGDGADWSALPVSENDYPGVYVDRDFDPYEYGEGYGEISTNAMAEWANAHGYDSITFENIDDGGFTTVDVIFNPKRDAKSADPVTYDDAGNVIPLSQRFNTENDDIRYSMKDSDGNTLSKEQQEFFKDSKARDSKGNLMVLYHGTISPEQFSVFHAYRDLSNGFRQHGVYTSTNKTLAGEFAAWGAPRMNLIPTSMKATHDAVGEKISRRGESKARIYQVYANVTNPLIFDAKSATWSDLDVSEYPELIEGGIERFADGDGYITTDSLRFYAYEKGHDGVIIRNVYEGIGERIGDDVIVFNPEQLKYTDNTNPTSDPDIRYSLKGEHEMRREIDRIRKEGRKAGKSQQEIETEVMDVVGPEYGKLLKTYGEIKRGERPYREISVPHLTEEDRKVSQTIRTILEAEATPDAAVPTIQELITKGDFSYDVYTDKEARAAAEATIRRKGYETALADWLSEVKEGKVNKTNTALGWELYNQAATKGDLKTAMSVLNGMVQHQRNAAQALQATRILKKMAPDAQLYGIQRSVESLQEDLAKKYGKKVPDLKVDEELAKKLLKAKTDEERDEATKEIYMDIGRQMPSTFIDKWNAWRYLAMLGNPRTHVRNVVGNLGFAPVVATKDLTATVIEGVVSFVSKGKLDRTKAMPNAKLLKAAWADYANVADEVTAGGKYSDSFMQNQYIQEGREIFKFKPLEKARKGNSAALEVEDMWFAQPHYAFALAQYCKAHGVTVEQLKTGKALGNARNYAIREAQKATYRDTNAFSQMVSELGRYSGDNKAKKGLSLVTEGILPFRKTPANILVRGIEYSPIGLLNGIKQALWDVSKGTKTGAEAIDSIAAGATGTALLGLGVYLASQGLIRGAGGDDEKEKKFEELQGHQTYALELPNGKSITLDWLAPEVLPLFIGVNLCEMAREDKGESNLSDILTAVSNVTEPLLEMSCLQSLNDLFDSVGYAASGGGLSALPTILASAATSYLTQAFPTILGQAERSAQDERMTTYTEKNGFLTSDLQYTIGKISAKIPGWDFQQIPYVDAWGRTESTGSRASNIANNFLNPAYTSQVETSEMEEELQRLHDVKGDEYSVLPSRPNKYFNVDGDRKDLTAEEYVAYATEKGQLSYDILTDLTEKKEYDKLPDAEKARAVEMAYEYANAIAKSKVSDYEPDSWVAKALEAEEFSGMDETEYILYKVALSMADQNNNDNSSYDNTEKAAAIASMKSLSDADIAVLLDTKDSYAAYDAGVDMRNLMAYIGEGKDVNVDKLIGAKEAGISESTYFKYTDTLKAVDQPNSNGEYGGAATNAEKAAAVAKMRDLDNEGIAYLWGTDQAHEAHSYGVDMRKYAQFKGVVGDFKGDDKQQQIKSYLKGMNLSAKDYLYLYGTVYSSVKDDADYLYYFGN